MDRFRNNQQLLVSALIFSMFSWGVSWPLGKMISGYGTPAVIAFIRFVIVFLTLFILLIALRINLKVKRQGIIILLISGILLAAYNFFFLKGLEKGFSGAGGVLVTTLNPVFSYSLGLVLKKRWPSKIELSGLILGLIGGIFLLQLWTNWNEILASGNLFFLLAAITWAILSKFTSKATTYANSLSFSVWMYLITFVILFSLSDHPELTSLISASTTAFWVTMLVFAILPTTIGTTFFFFATTHLGAERASSFIFLVPISALISSWLMLGEVIQLHTIVGGCLGILAVIILNNQDFFANTFRTKLFPKRHLVRSKQELPTQREDAYEH